MTLNHPLGYCRARKYLLGFSSNDNCFKDIYYLPFADQ